MKPQTKIDAVRSLNVVGPGHQVDPLRKKERTVVIDDDPTNLKHLKSVLQARFDVEVLDNQAPITTTLQNFDPDLILLDLHMPQVDGFEILAELRRHPSLSDIPTICMSRDGSPENRARIEELGAVGFLHKPFDYQRVSTDLESILRTLDNSVESISRNKSFQVVHNNREKRKRINQLIERAVRESQPTIFLTWENITNLVGVENQESITAENLVFLQYKPSLVMRFRYLNEFTQIANEIKLLTNSKMGFDLVMDEPNRLLKATEEEVSLTQMEMLVHTLELSFNKLTIVSARPREKKAQDFIQRLGRSFLGL